MKIAIVGHAQDKFTPATEKKAKELIFEILMEFPNVVLVSGRSPMGGVDLYAEEVADKVGIPKEIKVPKQNYWDGEYGFKARNLDIARCSDVVHVIVVSRYPDTYTGIRFNRCYHCDMTNHVKSGACFTAKKARALGKKTYLHILE